MTKKSIVKFFIISFIVAVILVASAILIYLKGIPALLKNQKFIDDVTKVLYKNTKIELEIENPNLITYTKPEIDFKVPIIILSKESKILLSVKNLDISLSFYKIFQKEIKLNKFGADDLFVDVNGLMSAFTQDEKKEEEKPSEWDIDFFDSVLYLKKAVVLYEIEKGTNARILAKDLLLDNTQKKQRFIHFKFLADIVKNNNKVTLSFADENKIYFKDKHFYIKNCHLNINKSRVFFDFVADKKKNYDLFVYGQKILVSDVIKFLQTNIINVGIDTILAPFNNMDGNFNFGFRLTNNNMNGEVKINKLSANVKDVRNMPFVLTQGNIKLNSKDITLSDFKGYYGNSKINSLAFEGDVKDYAKSADVNVKLKTTLTNNFMHNYISKLTGTKLELLKNANALVGVKFSDNVLKILAVTKIAKGNDILVEGESLSPQNYDRAVATDLELKNNVLTINKINYYIASVLDRNTHVKPILTINGNFDISKNKILDLGLDIPKPLPSEFLNIFVHQRLFKKGTFWGDFHYYNTKSIPYLVGDLEAQKVLIPSQRLYLKSGSIKTTDKLLNINAQGRYRRSKYELAGSFQNSVLFPIIVKDMNLTIQKIDIDKMLKSMNTQAQKDQELHDKVTKEEDIETDEGAPTFDMSNIIVEKAQLNINEGNYKEIKFGNVKADMTLNKNSLLEVKSNRFDIAEGISSTKIECDLKNHKYSILLGVKDVNSDIISTSILNLPREISGKASGIIKLNTDDSLKLNGLMKFNIKNGQIQKIGLIEYILNFAAIFRNPLVMISPTTIFDMINIPEGNFDKISGELDLADNKIKLLKIKSQAPQSSNYIVGMYDLEKSDAILRIYSKFSNKNKGMAGFLRGISLNSLANKISVSSKIDENYYSSELKQLPEIDADEKNCQIFLTKIDGDIEHNNFISSLKKIK